MDVRQALREQATPAPIPPPWIGSSLLGYRASVSPWALASTLIFGRFGDLVVLTHGTVSIELLQSVGTAKQGIMTGIVSAYVDIAALKPSRSFIKLTNPV